MSLIQEVFVETDWEETHQARAARDERAAQLQAQGLMCSCTTLQRVTDGHYVFLVEAQEPEAMETEQKSTKGKPSRPKTKNRSSRKDVDYR